MTKIRLDEQLVNLKLVPDLLMAKRIIMSSKVVVNNQKIDKPGTLIDPCAKIQILGKKGSYVSRGGEKIAGAWNHWQFAVQDKVALDIGISTGGFTDFLLKKGIKFVFGVDVSYGITDLKIRNNPNIALIERFNARNLTKESLENALKKNQKALEYIAKINLVIMDVSFISVAKILPAISKIVKKDTEYIILIKPQFEAMKEDVGERGIINDPITRQKILDEVESKLNKINFQVISKFPSPIEGTKGNQEEFFRLKFTG